MVLDLGKFMIHLFSPEARTQYHLDGLWTLVRDPMLGLSKEETVQVVESSLPEEVENRAQMRRVRKKQEKRDHWVSKRATSF